MADRLVFLKWARDVEIEKGCLRRHRIYDYDAGHVRYQFGHYPTRKPYYPTEKDWELLDLYAEKGLGVVHVWWWNDMCGFLRKGVYEPLNEKGLRRFIDECHRRKLKVIPYVSPGFLDVRSSIYRPEWSSGTPHLKEVYYDLDRLCPGSPGWRAYFFSVVDRLMDDYGFDGLYWDGGFSVGCSNPQGDNHIHFVEFAPFSKGKDKKNWDHIAEAKFMEKEIDEGVWALWNDFICEIYARVKRRNGLIVAHIGGDTPSPFKEKAWDYQLLGEGIPDISVSIEKTKFYEPYVIRFNDWSRLITNWKERDFTPKLKLIPKIEHLSMAGSIPYLQFLWLEDGNYGEEEDVFNIPDVSWKKEYDVWTEWMKAQKKAGLSPTMGASSIAGRDRYFKYLDVYRQMAKENTVVYIEVKGIKENRFPLTEGNRRVSIFINDSLWVAIGNLGTDFPKVLVRSLEGEDRGDVITLNPGALTVLRYYDLTSKPEIMEFSEKMGGENGREKEGKIGFPV